jgi:hypothetical protein
MKDKITSLIRIKGPVLPIDVSKSLNTNSIMAGAYLSELVSTKILKISSLKVGGSPLYYLPGQESKLQEYVRVLKIPEKKAYDLLQEKKILKDDILDPVTRVSLQNIKDFAKPIEITFNDKKEKYWKWFLLSSDDLQILLKNKFENNKLNDEGQAKDNTNNLNNNETFKNENKSDDIVLNNAINKETKNLNFKDDKDMSRTTQGHEEIKLENQQKEISANEVNKDLSNEKFNEKNEIEKKETEQNRINNNIINGNLNNESDKIDDLNNNSNNDLLNNESEITSKNILKSDDDFLNEIKLIFDEKNISVLSQEIIKSNTEIEFKLLIPTPFGKIFYFAVAKSKKRCSDADLAQAYVKAEMNKLPVLFIHKGDLTKKAILMLKKEFRIITPFKID